jgi:hypothetical protein
VSTGSARRRAARKLTVNLKHGAVPKGYKLKLKLAESDNVVTRHGKFSCASYFKPADLANAQRLGGPGLPNITLGTAIQSACSSAASRRPYATLGELLGALNAPSGTLPFVTDRQVPNAIDGTATFNYPVKAFGVIADKAHSFTGCAFGGGPCTIAQMSHPGDYVIFSLSTPAPAGTTLPVALVVAPGIAPALPFKFFGIDPAGHRQAPLLTSGPQ